MRLTNWHKVVAVSRHNRKSKRPTKIILVAEQIPTPRKSLRESLKASWARWSDEKVLRAGHEYIVRASAFADPSLAKETCPICLAELGRDEKVVRLPCHPMHVFHFECFEAWARQKRQTCPVCKSNYVKDYPMEILESVFESEIRG